MIKIGIVEDEMVIARTIEMALEELGYRHCGPASTYTEAIDLIETHRPDLLLLDINLAGKKNGIDVARAVRSQFDMPIIYLTALSDRDTLEHAKPTRPNGYLVKPFTTDELFANIELALSNFVDVQNKKHAQTPVAKPPLDHSFFKAGQVFHKVYHADIVFIESVGNYAVLHCVDGKTVRVRSSIKDLGTTLPSSTFCQVHRAFIINIDRVRSFDMNEVVTECGKVPIGKNHVQAFTKCVERGRERPPQL